MRAGFLVGLSIATGYVLQTMGLQTIPSSKSAFITALYVPLVPILQWLVLRRPPGIMAWTGAGFAFAGMLALAGPDGIAGSLGKGEWLTIISTLVIAGEIIAIGHYAPKVDARRITIIQLGTASLLSFAAMMPAGESVRMEEHTSELQSLMRTSYAGFCLKNKNTHVIIDKKIPLHNTNKQH